MDTIIQSPTLLLSPILVGTKFGEDFFRASYRRLDDVLDLPAIHIDCEGRNYETTATEKAIMQANGYVPGFSCLIAGWEIWVQADSTFKTIQA